MISLTALSTIETAACERRQRHPGESEESPQNRFLIVMDEISYNDSKSTSHETQSASV